MATQVQFCLLDICFVICYVCLGFSSVSASNHCSKTCVCLGDSIACDELGWEHIPNDLPAWTKFLSLTENRIKKLSADSLRGLDLLEEIDLSKNEIESIDDGAFDSLPNLKKIVLSNNNLEEMPSFAENSPVTEIVINHNRIRAVNATSLSHLGQLRHLDLSNNRLTDLPVKFPALPRLSKLYLNNNRIVAIGNGTFGGLTGLETLRLTKNQISALDKDTFVHLVNLRTLELNKNKLTHIDGLTFSHLGKLEALRLKRNNITQLKDGCFYGLDKIQELELDNNNVTMVTKTWLYGLDSLKKLTMTHNNVRWIEADAWEYCPNLQELELSNNALTHMDVTSFSHLSQLKSLWLSDNKIAHIGQSTFQDMASLETLDLNNNQISWSLEDRGGAFAGLSALASLSVENNRIQSVNEDAFVGLPQLRVLSMDRNNVSTIHHLAFRELTLLQELYLNTSTLLCDCNLSWLPGWLVEAGFKETVGGRCSHPQSVRGMSVYNVSLDAFLCERSDYLKPLMVSEPEDMIALKGQVVTLHCSSASSIQSAMTVQWRKDNFPIDGSQINTTASMLDDVVYMTSQLVISDANDEDSGSYQCMAVNEVGKTYSRRARISVHVFPAFTKRPRDVVVKSSQFAILQCAATGQPDPEISWQKDGGEDFPAARERRMQVRANDEFLIANVKLEDQGVYTCTATNAAGTIMTNATFTVLEPPKFAQQMTDQSAYAGDTAVLECMAQGSPQPTVVWLKDGEELHMTERHFFTAENQLLVIVEARTSDSGIYTCQMTNTLGRDSGSMQLHVRARSAGPGSGGGIFSSSTTTTGVIIIAVVCCVVGTSLIWVVIIYQTRRKNEEYSSTPTEETTVPEAAYRGGDSQTEKQYATRLANGTRYVNAAPVYANGKVPGSHCRQIALADGVRVTYDDKGLRVTHNPRADLDWLEAGAGEYQLPLANGQLITAVLHHEGKASGGVLKDAGSSEEYSHSSNSTASSSPGTQSTQSTTVLSTFQPYPASPTGSSHPHLISPTSPHNLSSQPLLGDEPCAQAAVKHAQSSSQHGDFRPGHSPHMDQSQSDCYATFPRPHSHSHVHKTSSCSHLQSPGSSQRQSLSALPEDGMPVHPTHTKRSRSNHNVKRPDGCENVHPLPPPPPTPPERRPSSAGTGDAPHRLAAVTSPGGGDMRTEFVKQFLRLTPHSGGSAKCIAGACDSPVPCEQQPRNVHAGSLPSSESLTKNSVGVPPQSGGDVASGVEETSQVHNGIQKQLANGHAAFLSHDDNKQSPVVSL